MFLYLVLIIKLLGSSIYSLSDRGTEMITPLPVPIHSRLQEISMAVIRTNENPSLPVPYLDEKDVVITSGLQIATNENTATVIK